MNFITSLSLVLSILILSFFISELGAFFLTSVKSFLINNLRYTDDTNLMAESEELKSLLMEGKEESEKGGLKLNIQKMKIMASSPVTSWQIDGETMKTVTDFIFLSSKITADGNCRYEIKRRLLLEREALTNVDSILKKAETLLCQQRSVLSRLWFFQ